MTITLDLPRELERDLSVEAAKLGLTLPEYVERLLITDRSSSKVPVTGEALVSYWRSEDLIGSRPAADDSRESARRLRGQAERRLRK